MTNETQQAGSIRVGISTCLLGEKVRYDGGHKHDRYLTGTLSRYFEYVPVCPEVEVGLSIPRPTLRLLRDQDDRVRIVMPKTGEDHTDAMQHWARARLAELRRLDLCGYVLKRASPSCGLRVRTFRPDGVQAKWAPGIFAAALAEAMPNLPIIEEGMLHDPRLRENWVERVFAYHRLKQLWAGRWSLGDLVKFHTAHKYLLLAHSPEHHRQLGRLVARAKSISRAELRHEYETQFMQTLTVQATPARHANVMQHMLGFFSDQLDRQSRREVLDQIADYRRGLVPLVVPLVLIRHYVRIHRVAYLEGQVYLEPHPKLLALRSHL